MTNLLRVADWLAWWGVVSLIAFFLFATFAHIVDLLFFPESDPEKPRQSAHLCGNRSGVPLQEGGVSISSASRVRAREKRVAGPVEITGISLSRHASKGFAGKRLVH